MAFFVTHLYGDDDEVDDVSGFPALLDELADADAEHTDVSVSHESGWTLGLFSRGRAIWENVDDDRIAPRHLDGLTRERLLELMRLVAAGDIDTVNEWPWQAGYC